MSSVWRNVPGDGSEQRPRLTAPFPWGQLSAGVVSVSSTRRWWPVFRRSAFFATTTPRGALTVTFPRQGGVPSTQRSR
jgi:hypothetical protein